MRLLGASVVICAIAITPMQVLTASLDLNAVNKMDRANFTKTLGGIFEKSPWVEEAWDARPFTSIDALHQAMVAVVQNAPIDRQVALLRAHPNLAGKEAQAGTLTAASTAEQASAGLNALSKEEFARLRQLNVVYQEKFGFPFLIAVRNHTKQGIFSEFERRMKNSTDVELTNGVNQVYAITRLRLNKAFSTD